MWRGWLIGLLAAASACSPQSSPATLPSSSTDVRSDSGVSHVASADDAHRGIWSAHGALLLENSTLTSSEGLFTAGWSEDGVLRLGGAMQAGLIEVNLGPPPELLWAPGSQRLAVTWSDGGAVGTWTTTIYDLTGDRPRVLDLGLLLDGPRRRLPVCYEPEIANLGAVAWLDDGATLLLAIEAPPHSSCSNMGDVIGFRVSLDKRTVLEEIPQATLLSAWRSHLGPEILGAEGS